MNTNEFTEVFQQTSIILVNGLSVGDSCPDETWEILRGDDNIAPVCSNIDQSICTDIFIDGRASWETTYQNNINGTNNNISKNGSVICTFPNEIKNNPVILDRITEAKSEEFIPDSIPCNISEAEKDLGYCFGTADYCPINLYINNKPQKKCSRITAIANFEAKNKFNHGKAEECKACYVNDKRFNNEYYKHMNTWCTSLSGASAPIDREDCLCFNPEFFIEDDVVSRTSRDPFLAYPIDSKITVWDKITKSSKYSYLTGVRGLWYNPCNNKAYLRPDLSNKLPSGKNLTSLCKDIDDMITDMVKLGVPSSIAEDFKKRTFCYKDGKLDPPKPPNGNNGNTFWDKYKWYILATIAIIFLIIIAIVGHYISVKDEKEKKRKIGKNKNKNKNKKKKIK